MINFMRPGYHDASGQYVEAIAPDDLEIINEINRHPWSMIYYEPWRVAGALIRCPWCKSSHKFELHRQTVPANCSNCGAPF